MNLLGINAYHGDSSAALIKDGKIIAAIEEERLRRIKHWAGFPSESIKWCLSFGNINIKDVDYIAISRNPLAHLDMKLIRILSKKIDVGLIKERLKNYKKIKSIKNRIADSLDIDKEIIKARVINVEHHKAHISSSFFISPFREAAVVSLDGFGDFLSTVIGFGYKNKIKIIDEVKFPHSLGIFYTAVTQFLGFWNYGDEYKIMGLSAYGKLIYLDKMRKIVKKKGDMFGLDTSYFLHDHQNVEMTWLNSKPSIGRLFSDKMIRLLGKPRKEGEKINQRHCDLAASLQLIYEEIFFHILNRLYYKIKSKNLVLAGGCIQNSLANGKIYEKTHFENVYIPPAANDAGTAIGAALFVYNQIKKKKRNFIMKSPFLGPSFDNDDIEIILKKKNISYELAEYQDLTKKIANLLVNGKIIGWFQGRMEFGPRALGNRSIIADPRKKEMKDILNSRIKRREWFRPFAPSILEEYTMEWFQQSNSVPFMEKVYTVKYDKKDQIPAVCHEDGTARLQTVNKEINHIYWNLINEFRKITNVPVLLNPKFDSLLII